MKHCLIKAILFFCLWVSSLFASDEFFRIPIISAINRNNLEKLKEEILVEALENIEYAVGYAVAKNKLAPLQVLCENNIPGASYPRRGYILELLSDPSSYMSDDVQKYLYSVLDVLVDDEEPEGTPAFADSVGDEEVDNAQAPDEESPDYEVEAEPW